MSCKTKFSKKSWPGYKTTQSDKRIFRVRKERQRYLIVCEGEKTEPNYFEALKKKLPRGVIEVEILGIGENTLSIVKFAKKLQKQKIPDPYDKVWVVFDKDSFPASDFDNAIHSAESNNFGCAWSNEAFELWYLLHFEYRNTGMARDEYKKSLSRHLNKEYQKNDPAMHKKLESKQETAIRNAEKLLHQHIGLAPSKSNPATKVHLLVKELNEYKLN